MKNNKICRGCGSKQTIKLFKRLNICQKCLLVFSEYNKSQQKKIKSNIAKSITYDFFKDSRNQFSSTKEFVDEGIVKKGKISEVSYQGKNCVYCQASANLISINSNGKKVEEMIEVCDCANEFFRNKGDLSKNLKKYKELLSSKNINRKECILLPFNALKKGIINGN